MTFRTTFRDTLSSRQIALIDLPCTKNARRIFAIVSTISIPTSASKNHGSHCGPSLPGSRLDADYPENGVLIPCRNSFWRWRQSCTNQSPPQEFPDIREFARNFCNLQGISLETQPK